MVALTATPAMAATVTVTTTSDVVNGADGLVSLREAVSQANAAGEATVIELAASTYPLTLCGGGSDDDANVGGDLDSTSAQTLTVNGNGAVIDQTCAGERVLDQLDEAAQLTLDALTITGGDNSFGAAIRFLGDVDLTSVTVLGNDAGNGQVLTSGDTMMQPTIGLVDSTVGPNTGTGIRVSFGGISVDGSTISQNSGQGIGATDGALSVVDSTFSDNGRGGVSTTGQGEGLLTFINSVSTGNGGPGLSCSACGNLVVTDSTISGNVPSATTLGGGIVWGVDQVGPAAARTATITRSTVSGNTRVGPGGGMDVRIVENEEDPPPAQIHIVDSTFSGNSATGADGRGGGIHAITGEVRVDNSTISGNSAATSSGGLFTSTGDMFLRHATVVGNSAPIASNLGTGEDLDTFASIIAGGLGAVDQCGIAGTSLTTAYNVGGDLSCLLVGTGDQAGVGDPQLGPLADNGGPTLTMAPLPTSPAGGIVPAAACTVFTVDQRGATRPAGVDCEAGSVEIVEYRRLPYRCARRPELRAATC